MGGTRYRLREDSVDWRVVDDEIIALDVRGSQYLSINASGAVLWPLLAEGTTLDELATALTGAFDITPEVARTDAEAFVAGVRDLDLIVEEAAP